MDTKPRMRVTFFFFNRSMDFLIFIRMHMKRFSIELVLEYCENLFAICLCLAIHKLQRPHIFIRWPQTAAKSECVPTLTPKEVLTHAMSLL